MFFHKWIVIFITVILVLASLAMADSVYTGQAEREYKSLDQLRRKFRIYPQQDKVNSQALCESACILKDDRYPAEIALRRVDALIEHLSKIYNSLDFTTELEELKNLEEQFQTIKKVRDKELQYSFFAKVIDLRRRVAFKNPLLDFDKILFIKRDYMPVSEESGNYMCDQYFGYNAIKGGGLFILNDPFSDNPTVENVLEDSVCTNGRFRGQKLVNGGFLSPELSYDGKTIFFAYTEGEPTMFQWTPQSTYHIFSVNVDGTRLTQMTDGVWNDFDPCPLPSGRIAFISERRGGYSRCHGRPVPSFTLYSMNPDGSDIIQLSHHETNEWQPSVNHDGMIVYTRWDYVDRGLNQAHHPWVTTPDGRDPRSIHGNFAELESARPHMEMDIRAIPNSSKYIATASAHHGQAYGSLVLIDPRLEDDDAMSQVKRITPDTLFPEAETKNLRRDAINYATAWPLDEYFYLCVYSPDATQNLGPKNSYGIYIVDAFGNKVLLYEDPKVSCLSPMPLRPQVNPPTYPELLDKGIEPASQRIHSNEPKNKEKTYGQVGLINVYDSLEPFPESTKIKALRIIQILPKTTPLAVSPRIGYGYHKGARAVMGTVPVEEDGSAFFKMPAGIPVYFQALDENGLAVQSMRSATYVQPGDRLFCIGCHEPQHKTPFVNQKYPVAMTRKASQIEPDVDGSNPFNFSRLVQPVLNNNCTRCHGQSEQALSLVAGTKEEKMRRNSKETGNYWNTSYVNLRPYTFYFDDENWTTARTIPGEFGAKASKLYDMLIKGHHDVKLSKNDLYRITLWLDCNSDFFGAYDNIEEQSMGEVVFPTLE